MYENYVGSGAQELDAPKTIGPESKPIGQALLRLEKALVHQQKLAEDLEAALQPVLRNTCPKATSEPSPDEAGQSTIHEAVLSLARQAEYQAGAINSILSRLTV